MRRFSWETDENRFRRWEGGLKAEKLAPEAKKSTPETERFTPETETIRLEMKQSELKLR